jgi:hypothetical protein
MSDPGSPEARKRRQREKIQRQLDEALDASFPASDPVSIVTSLGEEDWGADDPQGADATEPSAPASSRPGSRS